MISSLVSCLLHRTVSSYIYTTHLMESLHQWLHLHLHIYLWFVFRGCTCWLIGQYIMGTSMCINSPETSWTIVYHWNKLETLFFLKGPHSHNILHQAGEMLSAATLRQKQISASWEFVTNHGWQQPFFLLSPGLFPGANPQTQVDTFLTQKGLPPLWAQPDFSEKWQRIPRRTAALLRINLAFKSNSWNPEPPRIW